MRAGIVFEALDGYVCVHADVGRAVELEVASETKVHPVSETAHHCLVHLAVVAHLLRLELCARHVILFVGGDDNRENKKQ